MKRILCILLTLILFFSLGACSQNHREPLVPIPFYYRTREYTIDKGEKIISSEQRESYGHREDYPYLMEMYLQGPVTQTCISPFPAGTSLEQLDLMADKVHIQLSYHISLISGTDLIIACICLAKTASQMTGMTTVRISAKGGLLDGKDFITITEDDFRLLDDFDYSPGK